MVIILMVIKLMTIKLILIIYFRIQKVKLELVDTIRRSGRKRRVCSLCSNRVSNLFKWIYFFKKIKLAIWRALS